MTDKFRGFLIYKINYSDSLFILKIYTEEEGIRSFFYRKPKKNNKNALLQPLSFLTITTQKSKGDALFISSLDFEMPYQTIPFDVIKSTILIFINEILNKTLKDDDTNESIFVFIEYAIRYLDSHENILNFHLFFLMGYSKFLGFRPYSEINNPQYLDVKGGKFTITKPSHEHAISGDSVAILHQLCEMDFELQSTFMISNQLRKKTLLNLIYLYEFHYDMKKLKSLDVLEELFN